MATATRTQRYPLFLPGLLVDNTTSGSWPRSSDAKLATQLDLIVQGILSSAEVQFKMTLDGVLQTQVLTIASGATVGENTLTDGLTVPADVFPGIKCIQASGVSDVVAWLTMSDTVPDYTSDPWVTPAQADLDAQISAPELAQYTAAILQTGQATRVPVIMLQKVKMVRGYISRGGNVMGIEGTIPVELLDITMLLTKASLFNSVATLSEFGVKMEPAVRMAFEQLKAIAEGNLNVSMPWTFAAQQMQTSGVEQVNHTVRRQLSRKKLSGLV